MLHNIMQHHFLSNIGFVVIVASMGIDLKYTTIYHVLVYSICYANVFLLLSIHRWPSQANTVEICDTLCNRWLQQASGIPEMFGEQQSEHCV